MPKRNCALLALLFLAACSRSHEAVQTTGPVPAIFSMSQRCRGTALPGGLQWTDSVLLFENRSITGSDISYSWDFGDGTSSAAYSPTHAYAQPGAYRARLSTLRSGEVVDTASIGINVVYGQRALRGSGPLNYMIDAAAAPGAGAVLLWTSGTGTAAPAYMLTGINNAMVAQWTKTLGTGVRLSAIARAGNGFILAGNYTAGATGNFALARIDASGNLLWQQQYTSLPGTNFHVLATSDGGYLTIGSTASNTLAVLKCDASGIEQWRRIYNGTGGLPSYAAFEATVTEIAGGYAFPVWRYAGTSASIGLVMIRLNGAGNITGETAATDLLSPAGYLGGGLVASGTGWTAWDRGSGKLFFFNAAFAYTGSKLAHPQSNVIRVDGGPDDLLLALDSNGFGLAGSADATGNERWTQGIFNSVSVECHQTYMGLNRSLARVLRLADGSALAVGDGFDVFNNNNSRAIYLQRYDTNGGLK